MNTYINRAARPSRKALFGMGLVLMVGLLSLAGAQIATTDTRPSIVGGQEAAPPFKYSWMAAIINSSSPSGDVFRDQFCGGTLIYPRWVLTAAHCVEDLAADDVDVLLGAHDLTDGTENPGLRQRLKVVRLVIHEDYDRWSLDNDIALLHLAGAPRGLSSAALISDVSRQRPGTMARAIGWGDTASSTGMFNYPERLQQVDMPLVSQSACNETYLDTITDSMLCAGYPQGGKGGCFGDSGGPLVIQDPTADNRWELIGITSFVQSPIGGLKCAQPGFPTVFAEVYDYLDWIERQRRAFAPKLPGILRLLLLDD